MNPIENFVSAKYKPPYMTRRLFLQRTGGVCIQAGAIAAGAGVGRFVFSGDSLSEVSSEVSSHYKSIAQEAQLILSEAKKTPAGDTAKYNELQARANKILKRRSDIAIEAVQEYISRKALIPTASLLLTGAILVTHGILRTRYGKNEI